MKIKTLHIFNIASIVDETIDFSQAPLADSDVFLITGNMGSGKTTILDSICLALYNTTPRLNACEGYKVQNNNDDIPLNDPRRLMRRNTGEAQVTLRFEGIDKHEYEATWQVQRGKYKKPNQNVNNVAWSLQDLTTGTMTTASNTREHPVVRAAIAAAVGLDFLQFCRTTMLAQGEFTKFLKCSETEKSSILKKITKLDKFTEAGRTLYEISRAKQETLREAQEKASDRGLTDEELQQEKQKKESLERQSQTLSMQSKALRQKIDWLRDEERLSKTVLDCQQQLETANLALQSGQHLQEQTIVSQWRQTIEARGHLAARDEASRKQDDLQSQLANLREEFIRLLAGQAYVGEQKQKLQGQRTAIERYLDDERARAAVYEQEQTIIGHLKGMTEASKAIQQHNAEVERLQQALNDRLLPEQQRARSNAQQALTLSNETDKKIADLNRQLQDLRLADLRNQREQANLLLRDIETAISTLHDISMAREARQKERVRLEQKKKAIEDQKREFEEVLLPRCRQAADEMRQSESAYETLRDTADKFAKQIRSRLTVGCTCPVCRQTVQTLPVEQEIQSMYAEAEVKYKEAKQKHEECERHLNSFQAKLTADSRQYDEDWQKHQSDTSVADAEGKALKACRKCGIDALEEDTAERILSLQQLTAGGIKQELTPKIEQGEAYEQEMRQLLETQKEQHAELDKLKEKERRADEAVSQGKNMKENLLSLIEAKQGDLMAHQQEAASAISGEGWQHDWRQSPQLFADELRAAARLFRQQTEGFNQLYQQQERIDTELEQVTMTMDAIRQLQPEWQSMSATEPTEIAGIISKANNLRTSLGTLSTLMKDAQSKLSQNDEALQAFLHDNPSLSLERLMELGRYSAAAIEDFEHACANRQNALTTCQGAANQARQALQTHLLSKPAFDEGEDLLSLNASISETETQSADVQQNIGAINQRLLEDQEKKARLGDLDKQVKQAEKEFEKWNRLNKLLGNADGSKFQMIAQSFILGSLLHSANIYLQRLEPRYTLKAVPETLHLSLEDAYQGFATRSTDSLSGGESFLVSLALALALADIGQALAVDTLFIDEGFGTLSGGPLTKAINTLRSLHSQSGRHVGIISHVQEVRDNIPVQIQVLQDGNSSSSTIRVV